MDRILQNTRAVRYAVLVLTVLSYTFLLLRRMKLNKLYQVEIHGPRPRSPGDQPDEREAPWLAGWFEAPHKTPLVERFPFRFANLHHNQSAGGHQSHGGLTKRLRSESSRLPKRDTLSKWFTASFLGLLAFDLAKYLAVLALKYSPAAADFGYLDCYLVGRPSLNGRTNDLISGFFISGTAILLAWPALELLVQGHLIRLDVIEFLLQDYGRLVARANRKLKSELHAMALGVQWRSFQLESLLEFVNRFQLDNGGCGKCSLVAGAAAAAAAAPCIQRPNRTPEAWLKLARLLLTYLVAYYALVVLVSPLIIYMAVPLVYTRAGFALQHRPCVEWALRQRHHANQSLGDQQHWAQFLLAALGDLDGLGAYLAHDRRSTPFMDWSDFCPLSWYHLIRELYSTLLTALFYIGMVNLLATNTAYSMLVSADMLLYSRALHKRLGRLTSAQRSLAGAASASLAVQTSRIQALLIDHFELLAAYDGYASVSCTASMLIWFGYSLLISTWIFLPGDFSSAHRLEWGLIHCYGSIHAFVIVGSFARVRTASRRLYPLITSAAALSSASGAGAGPVTAQAEAQRRRWLAIMRYYSPISLYCFRALQAIELSWLFLFKLTMWLFSALLVVSTFYSAYKSSRV